MIGIGEPDAVIESGLLALRGHAAPAAPGGGPSIVGDSAALDALRTYLRALLGRLEHDAGAFEQSAVRAGVTSPLLGGLLDVFAGDSIVVADAGGGASRRRLVDAAKTVVGSRGEAPMTVPELTALLGVSMRTLKYAFRDVRSLSPVQYLRAARLLGVRRELLRAGPVMRVSDAAARWGFWHLSQFAADYKRLFGELPSERLRVFRSCPLITPERARSLLQMLAIARAMSALCAWIGHLLVRCSDTLEKLSASETLGRVR